MYIFQSAGPAGALSPDGSCLQWGGGNNGRHVLDLRSPVIPPARFEYNNAESGSASDPCSSSYAFDDGGRITTDQSGHCEQPGCCRFESDFTDLAKAKIYADPGSEQSSGGKATHAPGVSHGVTHVGTKRAAFGSSSAEEASAVRSKENSIFSERRPRMVWSPELHSQFVRAVNAIGIDEATPSRIMRWMDVEGLTRDQVSSHFQKFRLNLRKQAIAQTTRPRNNTRAVLDKQAVKTHTGRQATGHGERQHTLRPAEMQQQIRQQVLYQLPGHARQQLPSSTASAPMLPYVAEIAAAPATSQHVQHPTVALALLPTPAPHSVYAHNDMHGHVRHDIDKDTQEQRGHRQHPLAAQAECIPPTLACAAKVGRGVHASPLHFQQTENGLGLTPILALPSRSVHDEQIIVLDQAAAVKYWVLASK